MMSLTTKRWKMSDKKEYIAKLVSITNEQVSKADGSGTYPAKVLTFEKADGSGTYDKKVPIAYLKKNTALGDKIKEAESSMIGEKVLLCTEGYSLLHIGVPTKKTVSGGGKNYGKNNSDGGDGQARGNALTNARELAQHQGDTSEKNILENAQMFIRMGESISEYQKTMRGTAATKPEDQIEKEASPEPTKKTIGKKAAGSDVEVDDFDF